MTTVIYMLSEHYIGKTDRKPGESVDYVARRRRDQHWCNRYRSDSCKNRWLQSLDRPPAYRIIDEVPDAVADTAERWQIQWYASRGYQLTNTAHNPYPYDVGPQRRWGGDWAVLRWIRTGMAWYRRARRIYRILAG